MPALLIGIILRALLLSEWPRAFYWPDSKDVLYTAKRWFENYAVSLHYKKTWLPPVVYTFGSFLPGGLLNWAAWIQHGLGLVSLLFVGGICRTWMKHWKWWIIPTTCLVAMNPSIIIWEHTIMQEPWFMPAILFTAWQTGYFIQEPTWKRFRWLIIGVILCAATRPEGKLFASILMLTLVLIYFKHRALFKKAALGTFVAFLLIALTSQKGQSGLLLMTSVVPHTPAEFASYPGLAEKLHPIRDSLLAESSYKKRIPNARTRKQVSTAFKEYLKDTTGKSPSDPEIDKLCKKIALSTAISSWKAMPAWIWFKFRRVSHEQPTCTWEERFVIDDQIEGLERDQGIIKHLRHHLFGRPAPVFSETETWVREHTKAPHANHWMLRWVEWWDENPLSWRSHIFSQTDASDDLESVPWFKFIAFAAMGFSLIGLSRYHQVQWIFVTALMGVLVAVLLSANIKPRFLFFMEPFWFIYPFVALDALFRFGKQFFRPSKN